MRYVKGDTINPGDVVVTNSVNCYTVVDNHGALVAQFSSGNDYLGGTGFYVLDDSYYWVDR